MFTIEQIKAAHAKVKSGADFPAYVNDLIALGVVGYHAYVADGHTEYVGENGYHISSDAKYGPLAIAETGNVDGFKHYLKIHQQGQTNYMEFCTHSAATGVEKWTVWMAERTCTYFDKTGNKMLVETIPA